MLNVNFFKQTKLYQNLLNCLKAIPLQDIYSKFQSYSFNFFMQIQI